MKLMQENLRILQNYLNNVSQRAQFLSEKIKFLSFKTIKGKIAQYILKLNAGRTNDTVEMPLTQQALAEMFGVTRPALARALGEMASEGILEVDRRIIRILDRRKLMDLMK
jgi:CRP-like cAMP-binding protein